jgi:hypothetical protein
MGNGALRSWLHKVAGIVLCLAILSVSATAWHAQPALAAGSLDLVRDIVPSTENNVIDIPHDFYFTLPIDAQQVIPTDWIFITMPQYDHIRVPTSIEGGFGTPVFSVVGHTIKLTGISLLSGTGLRIIGALADNPGVGLSQAITIQISTDSAGVTIRNQATTVPTATGGYVTVGAIVETILSSISISGYTSPNAFCTLIEGSSVIGTVLADNSGYFLFSLTALTPGDHTFRVNSTDSLGLSSSASTLNQYLLPSTFTTITGILLSPSISLDKTAINPGEVITASGTAKPNSTINLFIEAPLRSYTTTTNAAGLWTYAVPAIETATYIPGQYQAYAIVQDSIGNQSITSPTGTFTVKSSDPTNPGPACDISHGDLNCNGITNLTDFSILLFHWQTNHKVADINGDGKVNLTDFSIMMFYFVR